MSLTHWRGRDLSRCIERGRWFVEDVHSGARIALLRGDLDYRPGDVLELPGEHGNAVLSHIEGEHAGHNVWRLRRTWSEGVGR